MAVGSFRFELSGFAYKRTCENRERAAHLVVSDGELDPFRGLGVGRD